MNDSATRLMVQARRETIISTNAREQAHCCAIVEQLHLNTDSHEEIQRRATGRRFALLALLAVTMMSGSAGEGPASHPISSPATPTFPASAMTMPTDTVLHRVSVVESARATRSVNEPDAVTHISKERNR